MIEKDVGQLMGEIVLNFIRRRLSSMFIKELPEVSHVKVLYNLFSFATLRS